MITGQDHCPIVSGICMPASLPSSARAAGAAAADAVVLSGALRITVLTPRLLRIEFDPARGFTDSRTQVAMHRRLPVPSFSTSNVDGALVIDTGLLQLNWRGGNDRPDGTNLRIDIRDGDQTIVWTPGTIDHGNLGGTYRTLDRYDGDTWTDGKKIPLEDGLISRAGWHLVDDSKSFLIDESDWVAARPDGSTLDWYFFGYGHDFRSALADFAAVSGPQPLPPRFVFGYWWSRYWNYSDHELRTLVTRFASEGMPIDVLVLDMDWHTTPGLSLRPGHETYDAFGEQSGWTGYTFNRSLFPDPDAFMRWVHGQDLKITLNLHPASGVPASEEHYPAMARALSFDTSTRAPVPFEGTSQPYMRALFDTILLPLEARGADFWWLDWQQWAESKAMPGLSNTWWLNHVFFNEMERHQDARGLIYHRWGGLGNHRYPIGFSGDSVISWASLAYQPHFTAMASNVLYGYWSHDIGGHTFDKAIPKAERLLDPELYARWVQLGVFSPVLRTHSAKEASLHKEPWHFAPRYGDVIAEAIRLRYRLAPYIYAAARDAYDTGLSLVRPMYYEWPRDEQAYAVPGQYMFGDALLVAPVTVPGEQRHAEVSTWLPPGNWYSREGAEVLAGPMLLTREYALSETPIFVREGAILPLYPDGLRNLATVPDRIVLQVYPGARGEVSLYDDDGRSQGYRRGEYARTVVHSERTAKVHRVRIGAMGGDYTGRPHTRGYVVELLGTGMPDSVEVDGRKMQYVSSRDGDDCWTYDPGQLCVRIRLSPARVSKPRLIVARFDPAYALPAGLLPRILHTAEAVRYLKRVWSDISALPEDVELAGQALQILAYAIAGDDRGRSMRFHDAVIAFEERLAGLADEVRATPVDPGIASHFASLLQR
jgi:alpha-glucosidase (family GH31 glycosyl hydrolase)